MNSQSSCSSRWLLLCVTLICICDGSLAWFGSSRKKPTLAPSQTESPGFEVEECPQRKCQYTQGEFIKFSCPISGCRAISPKIPSDVEDLALQDNRITEIPVLTLTHLQRLDLADNQISKIDDNAFVKLNNLTMLYLSNNRITELKADHFRRLINLKHLYLDQNRLTVLNMDVFFPALTSIVRLDLSTNHIHKVHESTFVQLSSLEYLHLERNNISNITTGHFTFLPKLKELTLSQNNIESIATGTFNDLDALTMLDLGYNQIKHLPNDSFCLLYPEVYRSKIRRLVLSNNNIETIEYNAFRGLPELSVLHLEYNPLREFPTQYLPESLEEIGLHHMPNIEYIPAGVFKDLLQLRQIDVYGNHKLSVVSSGSFNTKFRGLKLLDLSRNNLKTLPENIISDWHAVTRVDLSGNPWHCDCKIRWMLEVYMSHLDRETIRCHTPRQLSGQIITKIQESDFKCGIEILGISIRERTGILLIAVASLIFVAFLGIFLYRCRHKVFPCRYDNSREYRALYNPKVDEESDVKISRDITVSKEDRKALQAEVAGQAPAPVAL